MWEELVVVLAYSKRTQYLLLLGVVAFIGLMLGGMYWESHLQLKSVSGSAADVLRDKIVHRYDKAAWVALGTCWIGASKAYRKARKRILG